jgi:hypothetical protein
MRSLVSPDVTSCRAAARSSWSPARRRARLEGRLPPPGGALLVGKLGGKLADDAVRGLLVPDGRRRPLTLRACPKTLDPLA